MKTYVTFGQGHTHRVNGKTFDCDSVAVVNGDRDTVFEIFGPKFCFEYAEEEFDMTSMKYFPRGLIEVNNA
jgi:hypothetical protein